LNIQHTKWLLRGVFRSDNEDIERIVDSWMQTEY